MVVVVRLGHGGRSLADRETSVIRLFVEDDLAPGAPVTVSAEQWHYLSHVMRQKVGARLRVFNGRDGEWCAIIGGSGRRGAQLTVEDRLRRQAVGPDLELIVALVKRGPLETIVEKAAELGARRVRPFLAERTNADHTNVGRLRSIAREAAEQTGRLDVPEILDPVKLTAILTDWPGERRLMFCDEAGDAPAAAAALAQAGGASWAIMIGPEGGFSPAERERIRALPGALAVSLGPRILRAETAAIAAMTLWQSSLGDWRGA
jgi:16S rRNA (uracil1498-N3)-methyltransferase